MKASRIAIASGLALSLVALMGAARVHTPSATKKAVAGTINVALPPATNLTWYFPLVNGSNNTVYNQQVQNELYLPLYYINNKLGIDYQYGAATNVTDNKQGNIYHVFLNKKLRWSNGRAVTSADVLWTWKILQAISAKNAPQPWPYAGAGSGDVPQGIKSVVANGPYEFTVTLKKPANQDWFIYNGLADFQPLPEFAWNKYPKNTMREIKWLGAQATNPKIDTVVDGPYTLAKAVTSQYWILNPNQRYNGPGPKARDRIIEDYEASNAAEFAALRTGAIQVGYVDLSEYGAIGSLKGIDRTFPGFNFGEYFVGLNFHSNAEGGMGPIFSQLYVRQAIQEAINQNAIDKSVYHGFAPAQYGPIASTPSTKFFDPVLKKPLYAYNLAHAKKLLISHGWKDVNGVMTKGGKQLAFPIIYASGSQATTQMMELIQANLKQIGVQMSLVPEQFSTLVTTITTPADENKWAAVSGIGIDYGGSYPTGEQEFMPSGSLDFQGYSNAHETALIKATFKPQPTEAAVMKTFYQYEYYTAQQLPVVWVPNAGGINAVEHNVKGVTQATLNPTTLYPLYQYWYLQK